MTKYLLNVEMKKAYAYSEKESAKQFNELIDAGIKVSNENHLHTVGMGCEPQSLPGFIRVSAKIYDKFGVKTAVVAKVKKTVSVADLAKMTEEEIAALRAQASETAATA